MNHLIGKYLVRPHIKLVIFLITICCLLSIPAQAQNKSECVPSSLFPNMTAYQNSENLPQLLSRLIGPSQASDALGALKSNAALLEHIMQTKGWTDLGAWGDPASLSTAINQIEAGRIVIAAQVIPNRKSAQVALLFDSKLHQSDTWKDGVLAGVYYNPYGKTGNFAGCKISFIWRSPSFVRLFSHPRGSSDLTNAIAPIEDKIDNYNPVPIGNKSRDLAAQNDNLNISARSRVQTLIKTRARDDEEADNGPVITDLPIIDEAVTITDVPIIDYSPTITDIQKIENSASISGIPVDDDAPKLEINEADVSDLPTPDYSPPLRNIDDDPIYQADKFLAELKEKPGLEMSDFSFNGCIFLHGLNGWISGWSNLNEAERVNLADLLSVVPTTNLQSSNGTSTQTDQIVIGPLCDCSTYKNALKTVKRNNFELIGILQQEDNKLKNCMNGG